MYANKCIGKGLGLKQIVSIAVIAVCMLTMILPWVHIGIRTIDGDMLDINTLIYEVSSYSNIDDLIRSVRKIDISDYLYSDEITARARKECRSMQNAVVNSAKAISDSKLTPVETASVCTNLAKVQGFLVKYDEDDAFGLSKWAFLLAGVVQWLLVLAFVALGAYCIYADLTGRKSPFLGAMGVYLILFLLYLVFTIYVNAKIKENVGDMLSWMVKSPTILHLQFAPIFGSILMIGNFVFWKLNADGSLGAGIENIGKKWCGNARAGQRTPRPADSARSAEMSVPRISRLWISRRMWWTGLSGPAPAEAQIPKRARSVRNAAQSDRLISPPRSLRIPRALHIPLNLHMPRGLRTPRTPRMPRSLRVPQTPHIPLILRTRLPQSPIARDAVSP